MLNDEEIHDEYLLRDVIVLILNEFQLEDKFDMKEFV